MQNIRSQLWERLGYFTTVKPLITLVWRTSPKFFVSLFVLTFLSGLMPLATIFVSSALLDELFRTVQSARIGSALPNRIIFMIVVLGLLNLLGLVLTRLSTGIQNLYQRRVENHVQELLARKAGSLDLAFFENPEFYNQLTNASNEASYRPVLIVAQLMGAFSMLTTLISVVVVLLFWQPWVVVVVLLASFAMFKVSARFNSARVDMVIGRTAFMRKAQYFRTLLTADWVAKEVRLFGIQEFLLANFRGLLGTMYRQDRELIRREFVHAGSIDVVLSIIRPLLFGFAVLQAFWGLISIGQFSLYTQSVQQLENVLRSLMMAMSQLHEHNLFVGNLFRFLDINAEVEAPRAEALDGQIAPMSTPLIEFRDVSFKYPNTDQLVINQLSFAINPGETIALVGNNGAGKTTLVKLLTGLYQPTSGQILFDGVDITGLNREHLRSYLSVIFQDYSIYHFSAYNNIGIGNIDRIHDQERVFMAARQSGLDRVIATLPRGYDTVLGRFLELGHELSGGQRQLVALTRALMRAAPVLVMDEPTAALDIHTERQFFQQLMDRHRMINQTVLFISHRFSTVRRADRILVLERGGLIEVGTHDQLMAQQGHYAEMFNAQVQMYGPPAEGHVVVETVP